MYAYSTKYIAQTHNEWQHCNVNAWQFKKKKKKKKTIDMKIKKKLNKTNKGSIRLKWKRIQIHTYRHMYFRSRSSFFCVQMTKIEFFFILKQTHNVHIVAYIQNLYPIWMEWMSWGANALNTTTTTWRKPRRKILLWHRGAI